MSNTSDQQRPTIYILTNERSLILSAYSADDPMFENNHIEVRECPNGQLRSTPGDISGNIMRNILSAAGINVVFE